MLVLSREVGTSIIVIAPEGTILVTVEKLDPPGGLITVRVADPSEPEATLLALSRDVGVSLGHGVELTLKLLRRDAKAWVGVTAPVDVMVHRLEVYETVQRENRAARRRSGGEDGLAGSGVPRPPVPRPPSLDVRLDEPGATGEPGG